MTVASAVSRSTGLGNGATTVFPYSFRILDADDLLVTSRSTAGVETTLVRGIDYDVSGVGNTAGGSVTLTTALASGAVLTMRRVMDLEQPTSISNQGPYFASTHEAVFDRLTMLDQQQQDEIDRSLRLPETIDPADVSVELPVPAPGKALGWNGDGTALTHLDTTPITSFGALTPLASIDAAAADIVAAWDTSASAARSMRLDVLGGALDRLGRSVFNVKDPLFAATGDGTTDDRAAIQAAITAALAAGNGTVVFPPGTYNVTSYYPAQTTYIFLCTGTSTTRLHLVLAPGAILTTALNTNTNGVETIWFKLSTAFDAFEVYGGGEIRNTHGLTAGRTVVFSGSSATNAFKGFRCEGITLRDHARTFHLEGFESPVIHRNRFRYTNGRDSGNTNLSDPNVGIWCFANSASGQTSNVTITDNDFDGCTSGTVASNTNKQGLDGLVYGTSRGWVIRGNKGRRWGVEFIYPSSRQAYEATRYPCTIEGNEGDGTLPTGAVQTTFGVRSDEHDTKSATNSFTNVQFGIDITGAGRAVPLEGCSSTNDSATLTGTTQDCYGVQMYACNAPSVRGPRVQWASTPGTTGTALYGVKLYQAHRAMVSDVSVVSPALPSAGTLYGCYVQQSHSGRFHDIKAEYCTYAFYENQHTTSQPGHRLSKISGPTCTTLIGGSTTDTDQMVVDGFENPMSADNGDASVTLRGPAVPIQRFDTALTANRTVTLTLIDSSGQSYGKWFRIVRTGLGAFTLTVQDSNAVVLKVIPAGTAAFVECYFNGTAWKLTGYGTL